jgi:hypothetical protein
MEEIKLPRHVIDGVERRWMSRLEQAAQAWKNDQRMSTASYLLTIGEGRHIPVVMRRTRKRTGRSEGQQPAFE